MNTPKKLIKSIRKHVGMRTIKTVIAVALCFVIYELRGRQGIPFYSALSAIWCIRPDIRNSKHMAMQRIIGTMIGAAFGLVVLLLESRLFVDLDEVIGYLLASVILIPIIATTVFLKKKDASYFSCVVFLSITINHLRDANPYLFVWNRVCDTMIGILVALFINVIRLPYHKNKDVLFVSGLDEVLFTNDHNISDFTKRELNRMLEDGMHFTIATMRTPASLIGPLKDIRIKLPVVAMDGAVLYNMKDNAYLKTFHLNYQIVQEITNYLDKEGVHYFINSILQDTLFIYYGVFKNSAEETLFQSMKASPYRNYLYGYPSQQEKVVYLTLLLEEETGERINGALGSQPFAPHIRWRYYPSTDYPGYFYLKIYDKESSRKKMIAYLKEQIQIEQSMIFGTIPESCDVLADEASADEIVRLIRKHYEPLFLPL